jgi:hypothetical protein
MLDVAPAQGPPGSEPGPATAKLPHAEAWSAAAARHAEFFVPLDAGARVGLLARSDPTQILLWEATDAGTRAHIEPFLSYAETRADIVLAADDAALATIRATLDGPLFETLRAAVRSGHLVCYLLRRRCVLEERGFDEMLDALGFAFMGACR